MVQHPPHCQDSKQRLSGSNQKPNNSKSLVAMLGNIFLQGNDSASWKIEATLDSITGTVIQSRVECSLGNIL